MCKSIPLFFLICCFIIPSASAEENARTTQEKLLGGEVLHLHWAGVYEGFDTVYKITLGEHEIDLGKLDASRQPVINREHNLIALPYCAHDGCNSKVHVVDLKRMTVLAPITLDYTGQFYLQCKWDGPVLEIQVEHEPWDRTKKSLDLHRFAITSKGIAPLK
jgi:hypothetical protein